MSALEVREFRFRVFLGPASFPGQASRDVRVVLEVPTVATFDEVRDVIRQARERVRLLDGEVSVGSVYLGSTIVEGGAK